LNVKEPKVHISRIRITVTSDASVQRVQALFGEGAGLAAETTKGNNVEVAKASDIIILGCPPPAMKSILSEDGMQDALKGKLLVSILAGVTRQDMEQTLGIDQDYGDERCWVFRTLPNLAVASNASATAIEVSEPTPPKSKSALVDALFEDLGGIVHVPSSLMNASTVLCGSAPAYVALFLDGMIDGAVAAGVPREKANAMAAQMLMSTAAMLKTQRASALRESICAMPGCTIQGNLTLEEGGVRGVSARAMKTSIEAASKLG
jgi:pyrroline-5-carboxylate reductase